MNSRTNSTATLFPSRIGLGLAALGRPGYINLGHSSDLTQSYSVDAMQAHANRVLDAAWAAGIRYFDAARSYGLAEQFLADWLRQRAIAPQLVSVGSKWGYTYTADWQVQADVHEVKEHSLIRFTTQVEETTHILGAYLRLYQIHSVTLESGVLSNGAVLSALASLRAEHGIAVGLSLSGTAQAETLLRAMEITIDGVRLFDSVQATWNLLERSAGDVLRQAWAAGMQVLIKEALANGRLTVRNQEATFAVKLARLKAEAQRLNTTIDVLALAAVLAQPWVDVVLSGAATVEQLQSNLAALSVNFDEEAHQQLESLVEVPDIYWATRSALPWN